MNEDYARLNADTINTPVPFRSVAGAPNFQFCLANRDPNNNPTNGIERRQTSVQTFNADDLVKYFSSGGLDAWDVNKYLNIWVCNLENPILGIGDMPSSIHSDTYGVIVHYNAFGRTGNVLYPYNLGRTCTHEISHCFNLYHIWGDDDFSCLGTDFIADTPNQSDATYGCHGFPFADMCTMTYPGIMFMNFMDYSDDNCMNMFTANQATRMINSISSYYPDLLTSTGCLANGIESVSDFEYSFYPNPSAGILYLDIFTSKNMGLFPRIRITDILGKIVYEDHIQNPKSSVYQLDLQHLQNGIYFVTIDSEKYKRTSRLLINHN